MGSVCTYPSLVRPPTAFTANISYLWKIYRTCYDAIGHSLSLCRRGYQLSLPLRFSFYPLRHPLYSLPTMDFRKCTS
jgi:hypothetical protein